MHVRVYVFVHARVCACMYGCSLECMHTCICCCGRMDVELRKKVVLGWLIDQTESHAKLERWWGFCLHSSDWGWAHNAGINHLLHNGCLDRIMCELCKPWQLYSSVSLSYGMTIRVYRPNLNLSLRAWWTIMTNPKSQPCGQGPNGFLNDTMLQWTYQH